MTVLCDLQIKAYSYVDILIEVSLRTFLLIGLSKYEVTSMVSGKI